MTQKALKRIEDLEGRVDRLAEILQDFVARSTSRHLQHEAGLLPPNGSAIINTDKEQH